jgi:ABC-type lipoprotein export system ATPase subunit
MSAAIEVRDLFRVHATAEGDAAALQGLSMQVEEGAVVAVLGPSGSGKSSLLRILAALDRPSSGVALVLGADTGRLSSRQAAELRSHQLGIVDQQFDRALPPDLTCLEIVGLQQRLLGVPGAEWRSRAAELLRRVGLEGVGGRRPAELSGGEQQRVAVCAALAHRPRLLLADEPTGELDAASAAAVYELIGELARAEGATVVVVSHDPAAAGIADRMLRIRDGRVSGEALAGGPEQAVVNHGGWVRLPAELLERGVIGDRLAIEEHAEGVFLRGGAAPERDDAVARPAPAPGAPVAAVRGVAKTFGNGDGRRVLDGLSTEFAAGLLTVVRGRSGTGKSTLLRMLAGLEEPSEGDVTVRGEPLDGDREELAALRRDAIAYAPQSPALADHLSAVENITLALTLRRRPPGPAAERAHRELESLLLGHRAGQRVHRLSSGEQQRVVLARALALDAPLVLVDEPTSRLDQAGAELVAERLAAAAGTGAAVVCATHDPLVVDRADRVLDLV